MNNSSNSFNICPRCGNSNALSAKYCSRCGGQLKVPEEPIVCHKCHTRNTPMANFCRSCGAPIKVGAQTKICPKCGREVNAEDAVCSCGYSFVNYQQTMPARGVNVSSSSPKKSVTHKTKSVVSTRGGRGWAIAALVLLLIFMYIVVLPFGLESTLTGVLRLRDGVPADDNGFYYGYNLLQAAANVLLDNPDNGPTTVASFVEEYGIGTAMITAAIALFVATAAVHFVVCVTRIVTKKRSKRANWYFFAAAIATTLLLGLIALFHYVAMPQGLLTTVAGWFAIPTECTLGYAIWAIPVYFWLFYLFSICAKGRTLSERAA